MGFNKWVNSKIRKLNWWSIQGIKLGTIAITLMFAKLVPGVLGLEWYWYLIFAIILIAYPIYVEFIKK